jgi:hypothetical protein
MSDQLMKTVQTHMDSFFATEFKTTLKDSISAVLREHDELAALSRGTASQRVKGHLEDSSECEPAPSRTQVVNSF